MSAQVIDRFGRIRVARESTGPRRYLLDTLLAPHRMRERLILAVGRLTPDASDTVDVDDRGVPLSGAFRATRMALTDSGGRTLPAWIQVDDYEGSRGRAIVFLFSSHSEAQPYAVVKTCMGGEVLSLRYERDALLAMAETSLRSSVPEVRAYRETNEGELLTLSAMSGRSIFRETKAALLPRLHVATHFAHAASWLTEFQRGRERGAHGDFWARNVLVGPHGTAVVDWENFDSDADPLGDIFHFPLTYALAFQWDARERADAVERFDRGFTRTNVVSKAIRRWFDHFASARGVAPHALRGSFRQWLERGAEGTIARPRLTAGEWMAMLEAVDREGSCVFSG